MPLGTTMRKIFLGVALIATIACTPRLSPAPSVDPTCAAKFVIVHKAGNNHDDKNLRSS